MSAEPALPADLRQLFEDSTGRTLSVPLPPGRAVLPEEADEGDRPAYWLSDDTPSFGLWAELRARHTESGLWPLLLDSLHSDDGFRPWDEGEVAPKEMSPPGDHDPAALLAGWWAGCTETDEDGDGLSSEQRPGVTAPFGRNWPGLAPAPAVRTDPDRAADEVADLLLSFNENLRLGLVATERGADAPAVAGWSGPLNHIGDTGEVSAVLRDWERRFGTRVVSVGFATLVLSVAAPPATPEEALRVAAEHFAFCPDNVLQNTDSGTVKDYANGLVGTDTWYFWWD